MFCVEKGDAGLDEHARTMLYGSPEKALERAEEHKALRMALLQLKKEYREVLYLRFFHNLSVEEIAKITKKNNKQVYNLLTRSKSALKETLTSGGFRYEID